MLNYTLISFLANHLGKNFSDVFSDINNYIIKQRFGNQIHSQVKKNVVSQIKYELSLVEISEYNTKESFTDAIRNINTDSIYEKSLSLYKDALQSNNYKKVLEMFNEKGLAKSIGHYLSLNDNDYLSTVIDILRNKEQKKVFEIFENYIPRLSD